MAVLAEGEIDAVTILSRKLIDTHYYAIANKASLSKPVELNPRLPSSPTSPQSTASLGRRWEAQRTAARPARCARPPGPWMAQKPPTTLNAPPLYGSRRLRR